MQLHALEPPYKIFYTFVCKNFSSRRLQFPGKNCNQIYGKSKAKRLEKFKYMYGPKNLLVKSSLYCVALV